MGKSNNNNNLHKASAQHVRVVSIVVSYSLRLVFLIYVNSEDTTIFFECIVNRNTKEVCKDFVSQFFLCEEKIEDRLSEFQADAPSTD